MAPPVADDGNTKGVPPRTQPYSDGVGHEANLIARDVRYGSEAEVQQTRAGCLLLAISGHRATSVSSPKSSKIGCTEIPIEPVQISLGILRISGSPQNGTEKDSLPYNPVRALSWGPAPIGRRTQRVPERQGFVRRVEVA